MCVGEEMENEEGGYSSLVRHGKVAEKGIYSTCSLLYSTNSLAQTIRTCSCHSNSNNLFVKDLEHYESLSQLLCDGMGYDNIGLIVRNLSHSGEHTAVDPK